MSLFMVYLLFSLVLHHSFLPSLTAGADSQHIVQDTCRKISKSSPNVNYSLCVQSLSSVPESHRVDVKGLGLISVRLASTNAIHVRNKVKELLMARPKDKYYKSCLATCLEVYSNAISSLKDSQGAIMAGHYGDANVWLSSVVDAPGTCKDGFVNGKIKSNPLMSENDHFFKLAVISLAFTAFLG